MSVAATATATATATVPDEDYDELIYHVPKQKRPNVENMGASVSVFPPLGQATQVQSENVHIIVLLEVPADQAQRQWDVVLWRSAGDDDAWSETPLAPAQKTPSTLQDVDGSKSRFWFEGQVLVPSLLNFTLKFRSGPDEEWRWARDEQGMGDGTIIVNSTPTTAALPDDFGSILQGYDSGLRVKPTQSQCPGTRLWTIEAHAEAAKGEESTYTDVNLGVPWGGFLR